MSEYTAICPATGELCERRQYVIEERNRTESFIARNHGIESNSTLEETNTLRVIERADRSLTATDMVLRACCDAVDSPIIIDLERRAV
ncbi:MAG TPA: hypothetical protein VIH90_04555 [Candidatus Saccharimonadales bacterium]